MDEALDMTAMQPRQTKVQRKIRFILAIVMDRLDLFSSRA
jgi:hypothetical protein